MSKRYWLLIVLALLAWSYVARPLYDFAWIALGRLFDRVAGKTGAPTLRMQRQAVVDRHIDQGDEITDYLQIGRAHV